MSDRYKGHDVALEALQRLIRTIPDVRWVMVGTGVLQPHLVRRAVELSVQQNVVFTGAISDDELNNHLADAHAFCLLSRRPKAGAAGEGFGIAYVEAGAFGLPVIAGHVPGVSEAVRDDVSGCSLTRQIQMQSRAR